MSGSEIHPLLVLGVGASLDELPAKTAAFLAQADVVAGAKRLLEFLAPERARKLPLQAQLDDFIACLGEMRSSGLRVVLLCGADPLYYGIGERLLKVFAPGDVEFHPAPTSLALAAARLKLPYKDWPVVSLHGRNDFRPLFSALQTSGRAAIYTDKLNTPCRIGTEIAKRSPDFRLSVCEDLGLPSERVRELSLEEASALKFSALNIVLAKASREPEIELGIGLGDELFAGRGAPYTKSLVRSAALSLLEIKPENIVWDLGAGSGAVSLEASALAHKGWVVAVEREPSRVLAIKDLACRARALCLEVVLAEMPACLKDLPRPDRIFLGGGLGQGAEILREACACLRPGGKLVVNCVLLNSLEQARAVLRELAWPFGLSQIYLAQDTPLGSDSLLAAQNPVFTLWARKPGV